MTLKAKHIQAFESMAETLLPSVPGGSTVWTGTGLEPRLIGRLSEIYGRLPHDSDRRQLRLLLGLLSTRVGGLALFGRPQAFTAMPPDERADAVRRMASSRQGMVRRGARSLKTLVALLWVTTEDPALPAAVWTEMGYPGPDGPSVPVAKPIVTEKILGDTVMEADVVVVGSGAGGGTAAGVLAAAGFRVVVLERGGYHNESDFTHLEADAYRRMYRDGALGTTADGGMVMLAGATLGGGTVINFTTSFATPFEVRQEWDRIGGLSVFTEDDFQESLDAASDRLAVNLDNSEPSSRDARLDRGLRSLGWHVGVLPRNADGCTSMACGYCSMGCRIGSKRSTLTTYLADAHAAGTTFVTGANVETVDTEGGRAVGVRARVGRHSLRVKAKAIVLAAGALDTPVILLRSGMGGPSTGRYLRLHPVTAVWARFPEVIEPWTGIMQARFSDQFADVDGRGYGFKFETAPLHPLFPSAFIGWEDGASFKRDVLGLRYFSVAGVLLRDRGAGRVAIRRDGSPVIHYRVSGDDKQTIRTAILRGAELLAAEGADEVLTSAVRPVRWLPREGRFADFVTASDAVGYGSNQMSYFSFHQMGSARMGSDPRTSVVDSDNRVHGVDGLYVMDASCFPTASGVNPMLTIAAIAHRGATRLARRLG